MGQTTGWTAGYVAHTCVNTEYPELRIPTLLMLCQDYADYPADPGDSGGPVFEFGFGTDVGLVGIHWGFGSANGDPATYSIFSAMTNIESDLGALDVVAP